jgi:hypothetical protein
MPHMTGRNVLLHEDNREACHIMTSLTSRSHVMMGEQRRLWCLLDTNDINLRSRYIRSATNDWADKLSRHLDNDDWKLDPVLFAEIDARFGKQYIDRVAFALNTLLPR